MGRRVRYEEPTALYWLFDEGWRLLYVGISRNPEARFDQHRTEKSWWETVLVEWFDNRRKALAAEREAIASAAPYYNISRPAGSRSPYIPHSGGWWFSANLLTFACLRCGVEVVDWIAVRCADGRFYVEYEHLDDGCAPMGRSVLLEADQAWVESVGRRGGGWQWKFANQHIHDWMEEVESRLSSEKLEMAV